MTNLSKFDWRSTASHWHEQGLGKAFHTAEQQMLDEILPGIYGKHLLYLDLFCHYFDLTLSPIRHPIYLNQQAIVSSPYSFVQGTCEELPFADNSFDAIILSHVLEFIPDPMSLLHEICRTLTPEGCLIIFCFNQWSLWSIMRLLGMGVATEYPFPGQSLSLMKIKRTLNELDCNLIQQKSFFYRPPTHNQFWLDKLNFLEKLSLFYCPWKGAGEMLLLKKQINQFTPLKPIWINSAGRSSLQKRIFEPTNRL